MAVHRLIPRALRRRVLSWPPARAAARWWLSRPRERPYVGGKYRLAFDGYRHLGLAAEPPDAFEAREREVAARLLETFQPRVIFDVGANIGLWTLWLAARAPKARIVAFEPDPRNLTYLQRNVSSNALDNVTIRSVGLSSAASERQPFYLEETGFMSTLDGAGSEGLRAGVAQIDVSTMDAEAKALGAPGFVKIDVEHHELEVLRGAVETLASPNLVLFLEITRNGEQVMSLLQRAGYLVHSLNGEVVERAEFNVVAARERLERSLFR